MPTDGHASRIFAVIATLVGVLAIAAGVVGAAMPARAPVAVAGTGLAAFPSDAALRAFLKRVQPPPRAPVLYDMAPPAPAIAPAPNQAAAAEQRAAPAASAPAAPGITNTQEAGVDEGGIVKQRGQTLVILRRGRLFTVSLAGGGMHAVDAINAFPPGTSGRDSWYDEMLIAGDRVAVIGYSYGRGGTEVNRFRIDDGGHLRFEDAYQLRSNDYYSSRNYASRLIGHRLVFYTPLDLGSGRDPLDSLPAVRRWQGDAKAPFRRIAGAQHVFIPPVLGRGRDASITTLHSVTTCDLTAPALDCTATGVLGAASRTFYVSSHAVYLWISDAWQRRPGSVAASAFIYRLPLDGSRPGAVAARGGPVDQFSFREGPDGLDVLVRSDGGDDRMWRPEVSVGDVALLHVPAAAFGDGSAEVPLARYRPLPRVSGGGYEFRNRFVGDWLLYGSGSGEGRPGPVIAAPVAGGPAVRLPLANWAERIDALGDDAVVIGSDPAGALHFAAVELGPRAQPGDDYALPGAQQGEERSQAFFFRADTPDGTDGLLGLPVARTRMGGVDLGSEGSAAMLFLGRRHRHFSPAGTLDARARSGVDDGCQASCVDWYGNARPIFTAGRVFALLGYELVEGHEADGRVAETGRLDFAPHGRPRR